MALLHELSSNRPSTARRLLGRCDIRIRMAVALAAIVAVVMCTRLAFGPSMFAVCLAAMLALRTPVRAIVGRLAGPLALACVLGVVRTFGAGSTPLAVLDLGPWFGTFTATYEGLHAGALIAGRVLGSLGILTLLCHDAPAHELFAALRWMKIPHAWVELAIFMYRYLHVFGGQTSGVIAAQKARLGYARFGRSLHSLGSLAGIVVLRSLEQVERSHEAMLARAYHGTLPLPNLPPLLRGQLALGGFGLALIAAAYLLAQRWPL